jgi:F0F1-type ATP synthase assembly protein I
MWKGLGLALTMPFQLAAAVFLGYWAGHFLDGGLGTAPWLGIGGMVAGVLAGFYFIYLMGLWLR